jgi:hypothetical protein
MSNYKIMHYQYTVPNVYSIVTETFTKRLKN